MAVSVRKGAATVWEHWDGVHPDKIAKSYKLMVQVKPDAVLILGAANSCLSVIGAKRLHISAFYMEPGNRCKDECLPEEKNRRVAGIISIVKTAGWAGGFDL